jgi:hypothetical protein
VVDHAMHGCTLRRAPAVMMGPTQHNAFCKSNGTGLGSKHACTDNGLHVVRAHVHILMHLRLRVGSHPHQTVQTNGHPSDGWGGLAEVQQRCERT